MSDDVNPSLIPALSPTTGGLTVTPLPPPPEPSLSELPLPIEIQPALFPALPPPPLVIPGRKYYFSREGAQLRNTQGHLVFPTAFGDIDLGGGHNLSFDPETEQGRIRPALAIQTENALSHVGDDVALTYTGSDLRLVIEATDVDPGGKVRFSKQLLECTTLSISVHRVKSPVRACGYINPKGFARGSRTIAGSIILTQFSAEVLLRFLQSVLLTGDKSKSDWYAKVDQLPPFNLTLLFSNENGMASYRRLLGVEMVDDGITYSQNDLMSEQTISYYASDMTPLLPLSLSSMWKPAYHDRPRARETVVADVMNQQSVTRLDYV